VQPLEHALGLFPECPEGAIDMKRDKAFVVAVRQAMPRLRELGRDLARFLDHLAFAPHSVIESPWHRPPEGDDRGARTNAHAEGRKPGKAHNAGKRRGGRRPLEQTNARQFQVYERIRREHQPGDQYVETAQRLKADKDFTEQVNASGLKLNIKLVRAALAFFDQRDREQARKNQENGPA
jgi:hypothetical protein